MQPPPYAPSIERFSLDRSLVFLNHGPFGAVPIDVQRRQDEWRRRCELDPVAFMVEHLEPALDTARAAVARFVNCPADDLAFVHNATAGVNTVVRSIDWRPGDELLISTHEYNACNNAVRYAAQRTGAAVICADMPWPVPSSRAMADAVMSRITPRTRLVLLSHITSPSAVRMPVESMIPAIQSRGVDVLLDSAHAPGMVDFDLAALAPAYCTGNLHKWVSAPKGCAFLYVRPDRQRQIRPLVISHAANSPRTDRSRFRLEFDFVGSMDYSPWLCAPDAIEAMASMRPGGWPEVRRHNRDLALAARRTLCGRLGVEPPAPEEMLGSMASVILPSHPTPLAERLAARPTKYADALQDRLISQWRIQVPVIRHADPAAPGGAWRSVRLSAQVYNTPAQYEYLAHALEQELAHERSLS
ncbi:MAG: aminotransferase class V-fold PLP-dependent enzyme [Phycisphaeraceae bacterium]|nr:aminotransferase class V-fold PLP-dependent enzyme [Phycisphaeraceae bacterium]